MKITLIYVGVGVALFNDNRPLGDREGSWIAHGISSVGASIKSHGYDVDLIDMRQLSGFDDLIKIISDSPSDIYGLSVSAVDFYPALKTAVTIKEYNPESKVIVGGIHPTVFSDKYNHDVIDTVVVGEGEITFPKLVKMVENGEKLPKTVQGEKPDLNEIPWVDRELFDYRRELSCNFSPSQKLPSITMLAGRGCPYQCSYCQPAENSVFGKPHRMRSPENVVNELVYLKGKYDYQGITFWDDTFTFSRSWISKFCELYKQTGINVPIAACSRADIICRHEDMVKELADIGLDCFVIGMESGSQRLLDFIKKGTTVEQNIESAKICQKHGIKVFATYMYGLPTETEEESLETYRMIENINPEYPSPFWFTPIEGTDIYKYCNDNNLIMDCVKDRTIARTGIYQPSLKGINYDFIEKLMGIRKENTNVSQKKSMHVPQESCHANI